MMNFFDVRTILFVNVLTDCLSTVVILLLWLQNRKRFSGMSFWLAHFFLQTIAVFLIFLRDFIPNWISVFLPNIMIITGFFLCYIGLERFFKKTSLHTHNYILLGVFSFVQFYFAFMQNSLTGRIINLSIGVIVFSAQCVWLMMQRVQPDMRKITRSTGFIFGGLFLASLIRIVVVLYSPQSDNNFFRSSLYETLVLVCYQLLIMMLSYSMYLMVNHQLISEIRIEEEKFNKAFRLSPYAITLTRISDGRILEVNQGFKKITGYEDHEVVGKTTIDLQLWANEKDRSDIVDQLSRNNRVLGAECLFKKKSGEMVIGLFSAEIIVINGTPWVLSVIVDITDRRRAQEEREKLIEELKGALLQVRKLRGLLPICSHCKKIRDDKGYWNQIETFIQSHCEVEFSHGICQDCAQKLFPEFGLYDEPTA